MKIDKDIFLCHECGDAQDRRVPRARHGFEFNYCHSDFGARGVAGPGRLIGRGLRPAPVNFADVVAGRPDWVNTRIGCGCECTRGELHISRHVGRSPTPVRGG